MNDLKRAIDILKSNEYTFCIYGDKIYHSDKRGVAPIIDIIENCIDVSGYCVADKVVGKAAAMLYVKLGVSSLYADVLSRPAHEFLKQHGIYTEYGALVDYIVNRNGDGRCPMESAVIDISDVDTAYMAIKDKINSLRG